MFWMDETGILADPADAGALSEVTLQNGTCVGVPAVLDCVPNLLFDKLDQFLHAPREDVMIVIAEGVGGYVTRDFSLTLSFGHPSPAGRGVWRGKHKDGFALGEDFTRVRAAEA